MIKATYKNHMGDDLEVVNAAKVSFNKESGWEEEAKCPTDPHTGGKIPPYNRLSSKDERLIHFLAENDHISPFGHCYMKFHVKAPIFVARQLVKHEYLRWNEISRRYVSYEPDFFTPDEWRGKPLNAKQGSDGVVDNIAIDWQPSLDAYNELLRREVCPEQARMVLPLSSYTEWIWSGSLDAFAKMCKLRLADDTQPETTAVAIDIDKIARELFPVSWTALLEC